MSPGTLGRTNRRKKSWTEGESDEGVKGEKLRDKGERTKKKKKKRQGSDLSQTGIASNNQKEWKKKKKNSLRIE